MLGTFLTSLFIGACFGAVSNRTMKDMKPDFGILSDEEIHYINNIAKTTWKAGRNFDKSQKDYVMNLLGVTDMDRTARLHSKLPVNSRCGSVTYDDFPWKNFDPLTKWPYCTSLKEIRDQGNCGSCWAVSAAEAITDRICVYSKGEKQVRISSEDVLSCCFFCGKGCGGGDAQNAWDMYYVYGLVSGGSYNTTQGCWPYEIQPCGYRNSSDHHVPCPHTVAKTPACIKKCLPGYPKTYKEDKHFGDKPYNLNTESCIAYDVYMHGPVQASFYVYADFLQYKSGIYQHVSGALLGGHAVKIVGYGYENGTKYWIVANSWNYNWGENGFFKILRGVDECYLESFVFASDPL